MNEYDVGTHLWTAMKESGAVWEHPGDPRAPHVVLRNGRHSNGFVDTLQYLSDIENLRRAAEALATKLNRKILHGETRWVFGSPVAGISFATVVAPHVGATRIAFTEKVTARELICRFNVPPGETFLAVEEMTTTGGTPQRAIDAILKKSPEAVPSDFVGAFLIRCDAKPPELRGKEIISVVSLPELGVTYDEWEPVDCPLCHDGSAAIENCKHVWRGLLRTMAEPTCPIP